MSCSKKGVYSIVAMLIATILCLFLYRSSSRIDIYPEGNRYNYIQAVDTPISYHGNCGNTNNQNCIKINRFDIPLFSRKDIHTFQNIGDGKLKIKVWGIYKVRNNKLTPVYNSYEDFRINGKQIAPDEKLQKLWHGKQFDYYMDVKDGDTITIEYKNRFVPSGLDWLKIGILWLICFIISFYMIFRFSWLSVKKILERDWIEDIKNFYLNINPVYRHSFWILFIITNIVFGYQTINFFWGNHDWNNLISGTPWDKSFYEARYGAFIMSQFLTGNIYLPIISALWAYIALSLSAILLAIYWKVPKKTSYFVIFGLILNITPYTCAWVTFGHWTVNMFFARFFIFAGFVLADLVYAQNVLKTKIAIMSISTLLLNFGLSIYTSMLGTFVMVIMGRILVEMLEWKSVSTGLRNTIRHNYIAYINTVMAFIIYQIIISYMKYNNIIQNHYNMEKTPLAEMPKKIASCINAAWQQFTNWSMPFYPDGLTKLFLVLATIFVMQIIFSKKSVIIKIFICATFMLSLFLTKTVALIAQANVMYTVRVEFCGYVLFDALIIVACLKVSGILQNIKIIVSGFIIYLFAVNSVYMQRTWKMGFDAEILMYNRMQNHLESNPNFDSTKKYSILQLGKITSSKENFYPNIKNTYEDEDLITFPVAYPWTTWSIPSFYNSGYVKKKYWVSQFTNPEYMSALKRLYDAGLLENAKAWPAENSIIVYEDIILVITDEKDLQKAKQILTEQAQKEKALRDRIKAKAKPAVTSQLQSVEAK